MALHRTAAERLPREFVNRIGIYKWRNKKKSTFCPQRVLMCFARIAEETAVISLYDINWFL
jgi:hypothetical protein